MVQEDAHVLDGGDQVVLDLLAPEPLPARAFEVMIVGRISKAAFHEVLSSSAIAACGGTVSLRSRYIQ